MMAVKMSCFFRMGGTPATEKADGRSVNARAGQGVGPHPAYHAYTIAFGHASPFSS